MTVIEIKFYALAWEEIASTIDDDSEFLAKYSVDKNLNVDEIILCYTEQRFKINIS